MIRRSIAAAAVLVVLLSACAKNESRQSTHRNAPVIIISIDTLRADHLPAYGYRDVETPNIDAIRKDGVLFLNAYAHVPLTLPSHISMLTGALPPENGVRNNIGFQFDAAKHETIPSFLHRNGYATGAAVSAYVLRGSTGIREAFDFFDDKMEVRGGEAQGEVQRDGATTEAAAESWIAQQDEKPFFFMLHLFEPHSPYTPPEPFRSRFRLPYDGEIATADSIVGKFVAFLKARKIYDRAIVIVMSDHGEGLMQHGEQEHGIFLYREDLHVPLIVKLPGSERANSAVKNPVGLIDIFPTIAALIGVQPPPLRGASLLEADRRPVRPEYAETLYPRIHLGLSDLRSLIDDRYHFIQAPRPELYDVNRDPAETSNVLADQRRVYAAMKQTLDAYGSGATEPSRIDPEEAKKLAALGYLSSSSAVKGPLPDPKDHIGEIAALQNAGALENRGEYDAAIAAYRKVLASNPNFTDAWTLLANTQEKSGRYADAIASYRHAIQLAPETAGNSALSIAAMSLNLDRLDDAEKNAVLAERTNPSDARVILGRVALARHDAAAAEKQARLAIDTQPDNPRARIFLAQTLSAQGRYPEALQVIDDVANANAGKPPLSLLDFVRGDVFARTGRIEEAKAAFAREIKSFPLERQAYASLAVLQALQGRRDDAIQTMRSYVRAIPGAESSAFAAKTFDEIGDRAAAALFR